MSRNPTISRHTGFGCAMLSVLLAPTLVLAKENLGSVTIGVVSGPDLIWTRSYGFADMEKKRMATKNSVYRIGSITKQFTGFTLLQLAEREKLRLGHLSVLTHKALEENFDRVNSADGDLSSGYGIGFRVSRHGGKVFHGHGGSVAGYRASALFHRASKTGVIVLRNVGGGFNVSDLARRALTEVATAKSRN
jgi:CubicO group peptidase (beta-lactamase class C family)